MQARSNVVCVTEEDRSAVASSTCAPGETPQLPAWAPRSLHSSAEGIVVAEGIKAKQGHAIGQTQGVRGHPAPLRGGKAVEGPGRGGTSVGQFSKVARPLGFKPCLHAYWLCVFEQAP